MKITRFFLFIPCALVAVFGVQVVDNPENPLNKKSGRLLQLAEVLRITDAQGGFYFKSPENIKIALDGSIFCIDGEQFLKFDGKGRFIKNLFRKGQGPGEFTRIDNYLLIDSVIAIFQRGPDKIVKMDTEGRLIKDLKPEGAVTKLLAYHGDRYVMAQNSFPKIENIKKDEGNILDVTWNLVFVSEDGKIEKTGHVFPTMWFAKRLPGAVIADYITDLLAAPFNRKYLVLSHTRDYRLQVLDLKTNQMISSFKRKYKSVSYQPEKISPGVQTSSRRRLEVPRDYYNDIQQIFTYKNTIWVLTSTWDKNKGFLVDVFNGDGRYVDNFYLPMPENIKLDDLGRYPITVSGDFLIVVERDKDDIPAIVKYRISYR